MAASASLRTPENKGSNPVPGGSDEGARILRFMTGSVDCDGVQLLDEGSDWVWVDGVSCDRPLVVDAEVRAGGDRRWLDGLEEGASGEYDDD